MIVIEKLGKQVSEYENMLILVFLYWSTAPSKTREENSNASIRLLSLSEHNDTV